MYRGVSGELANINGVQFNFQHRLESSAASCPSLIWFFTNLSSNIFQLRWICRKLFAFSVCVVRGKFFINVKSVRKQDLWVIRMMALSLSALIRRRKTKHFPPTESDTLRGKSLSILSNHKKSNSPQVRRNFADARLNVRQRKYFNGECSENSLDFHWHRSLS